MLTTEDVEAILLDNLYQKMAALIGVKLNEFMVAHF